MAMATQTARPSPAAPRMRVAQIWNGEVMDEITFATPSDVSLGAHAGASFVIPDLGLPPTFHLLRTSSRGYMLTIGEGMTGQLSTGGRTMTVTELLSELRDDGGAAGRFRAVPVKPGDWGIIHIDGAGEHTFFYQLAAPEPPLPRSVWRDSELVLPALLFAGVLHAILLSITWIFFAGGPNLVFGSGDQLTSYLVRRPERPPPEPPPEEPKHGSETGEEKAKPAATEGEKGKVGGEGEKPRQRAENALATRDPVKEKVKNKGLLPHLRNSEKFAKVTTSFKGIDDRMDNLRPTASGYGRGSGTGVGDEYGGSGTHTRGGAGPGGGGTAHDDIRASEEIKTGGTRAPKGVSGGKGVTEAKVQVDFGSPEGDFGDLSKDQVAKVVNSRRRSFQACFEAQLQRNPNLSGKIVLSWRIKTDGTVEGARVKSSTMGNAAVESCMIRRVSELKFPAPNSVVTVNYPFIFAPTK